MKQDQSSRDTKLSKYLSLVLRHNPAAAGIQLDQNGWADVPALLNGAGDAGKQIDLETLERIVRENGKQRFRFNEDHTKIRANQGHSLLVDLEFKAVSPPRLLYHGTATRFLDSIRKQGILKQSRQYVHLSPDQETASKVGARHGIPIVLVIGADEMSKDGFPFYLSDNGVWLCETVPWKYIKDIVQ